MKVRAYTPTDFEAVFNLINRAAEFDQTRRIPESVLRRTLALEYDQKFLPETAVVTRPNGTITAFAWWEMMSAEQTRLEGWVHPDYRRKGYGTLLLTAIEADLRGHFPQMRLTARAFEDIPGVFPLFTLKDYQHVRRFHRMRTTLVNRDFDLEPPSGISLRYFNHEDLESLVEVDNTIFVDHWGSQPRTVQKWERDMIDNRPHDPKLWIVAWAGDNIVAECLCHASREGGPNDGWVSVVGVRREWRGRSLGRTVLARGLKALQHAGYETAGLMVDAENVAAVNLYHSLEMDIIRTLGHFQKTLT